MANILDLLGTVLSPQLSHSETSRLRSLLHERGGAARDAEERPWPSGIPDTTTLGRAPDRCATDELSERVAMLELTVKVLCDALTTSGAIDGDLLARRLRSLDEQLHSERVEREQTVVCVTCGARVPREEANVRATGTLCTPCHIGGRARGPKMKELEVESTGGYREPGRQVALVEETVRCAACAVEVPTRDSFLSAEGALCTSCHLERGD